MIKRLINKLRGPRGEQPILAHLLPCEHEAGTSGIRIIREGVYRRKCGKCGEYYDVD